MQSNKKDLHYLNQAGRGEKLQFNVYKCGKRCVELWSGSW